MSEKKPNQLVGTATDIKWAPDNAEETIKNDAKEKYANSKKRDDADAKIPQAGVNPALAELRAVKAESLREEAGSPGDDAPDE